MSGTSGESAREADRTGDSVRFTEEESEVLEYLRRSKRVDLRWLDEERKAQLTEVLDSLHNDKKLSLLRISKEVGKSYVKIWGLCRVLQIHTRSVAEADANSAMLRSKHTRSRFAGSEDDKNYMNGFTNGDLTALK